MKSFPIWIKFPNLKLHLWSVQVLSKIASVMGTPLFTDKITASREERVDYARICVEIPFDRALEIPNSVTIEDEKGCSYIQEVQYEWLPYICLPSIFGFLFLFCSFSFKPEVGLKYCLNRL